MNEFQNRKMVRELQKPIPGCMGRMISILDLNAVTAGRKMLTDRVHRDGYSVCRSEPDVPRKLVGPVAQQMVGPVAQQIEDKPVTYELSSKKKSGGTPMKMLIAQEMSRGTETKRKPPSVVAKLMGLDALPAPQPIPSTERAFHRCYRQSTNRHDAYPSDLGASTRPYEQQEREYFDKTTCHDMRPSQCYLNEQKEYKDVYEIWPQPSRSTHRREQPFSRSFNEDTNENRMALVRQKFIEAKRLATDQKLLQTKEFQDALEVLNSNRDLFLKFLEEPNSLLSRHLQELRTGTTSPQTKCITVLKPSNAVKCKSATEMRKQQILEDERVHGNSLSWSPGFVHPKADNLSQPTRIVVLKPSPKKLQDVKASASSPTSCRGLLKGRDHFEDLGTHKTRVSRELAKDTTQQMRESLCGNQTDGTLFSPVLSYGYIGDESSFNRSENEFMVDDDANFSDSEIVSPTSRHSWDYVYRFGSPFSLSSFSQTSYSPESSVIREAKKRLSERWAMVASNGSNQEQKHIRKSSSTLAEMLAISELKKGKGNHVLSSHSCGGEQEMRLPPPCSSSSRNEDRSGGSDSPRNLLRSKSVPVFSSTYDNIELNVEISDSQVHKSHAPKDLSRSKGGKLSLRGKVSSLLFSRNKRPSREKTVSSPLGGTPDRVQPANLDCTDKGNADRPLCAPDDVRVHLQNSEELPCDASSLRASANDEAKEDTASKAAASPGKPRSLENSGVNQEQPSPISVLEAHFDDDVNSSSSRSSEGANLECCQLISRSPPIESVARSLSWEEAPVGTRPTRLSMMPSKKDEDEEQYSFVKALLSCADFDNEKSSTALARWHSPDSPLDPLLLDKFLEHEDEETKCREKRSNQRLLFDCINLALLDISWVNFCGTSQAKVKKNAMPHMATFGNASITEEVWGRIKEWLPAGGKQATSQGENVSLVVDRVLRKEVAERGWTEMMLAEMDEVAKETQGKVLEELLEEALADLFPGCF